MRLYRVFPYDASAAATEEGGALYVPPPSSLGRVANAELYRELYLSSHPEAAVAEVFGHLNSWHPNDFIHANGRPYAVASYELDTALSIYNLDSVGALKKAGIARPSDVVTRRREVTQLWARTIFSAGSYAGVSWWSPYSSDWTSYALWDIAKLRCIGSPDILTPSHTAVATAARIIVRQVHR